MNRRWYLYVKAFSDMGSMMDTIVLTAVIYSATHSSVWLSASLGIRTLGGLISSLMSGVLADRRNRRTIMVVSDCVRAAAVIALIINPGPWMILAGSFVIGFFTSYFAVSFSAEVPRMFGETQVLETNALISRLSAVSMVLGFFGAGLLTRYGGSGLVLSVDALSYALSAVFLGMMKWDGFAVPNPASQTRASIMKSTGRDLHEVWRYLRGMPLLLVIFVGYLVETFGASSHNVGVPLLAQIISPEHQSLWYGLIWGVWAVGNVFASVVLPRLAVIRRNVHMSYWVSTVCMSMGFITFLSNTNPAVVLPFAFLTGIFDATSGTLYNSIMQQCDNRVRGRVFGVSTLINRLGFGIGFVVAPILLLHMPMPHMVWWLHGTVITCTILSISVGIRYVKRANLPVAGAA